MEGEKTMRESTPTVSREDIDLLDSMKRLEGQPAAQIAFRELVSKLANCRHSYLFVEAGRDDNARVLGSIPFSKDSSDYWQD